MQRFLPWIVGLFFLLILLVAFGFSKRSKSNAGQGIDFSGSTPDVETAKALGWNPELGQSAGEYLNDYYLAQEGSGL